MARRGCRTIDVRGRVVTRSVAARARLHTDLVQPTEAPTGALDRSLAAYGKALPEQDAFTVGAAEFFGVSYDDVTPQQRAAWKWVTESIRYNHTAPAQSTKDHTTLRDKLLRKWPALREFITGETT